MDLLRQLSESGGLCDTCVMVTNSGPVPWLLIVMLLDAVAFGCAFKVSFFGLTEMRPCPAPGVGVAVGVAVSVAIAFQLP